MPYLKIIAYRLFESLLLLGSASSTIAVGHNLFRPRLLSLCFVATCRLFIVHYLAARTYVKCGKMPPNRQEEELQGHPGNNLKNGVYLPGWTCKRWQVNLVPAITRCHLSNPTNFSYAAIDPEEAVCLLRVLVAPG